MLNTVYKVIEKSANALALPVYTRGFLRSELGREYGLSLGDKIRLLRAFKRNATEIVSATSWLEHLTLVTYLLSLPKSLKGDVIECGCFNGSSTSSLSLACAIAGRKLIVCDSFEGLPEVTKDDETHLSLHHGRYETYKKGDYTGQIEVVQDNVRRYGDLSVCEFVKGYFEDTLDKVQNDAAFIFLDVDLHNSLRTCLVHLWPRLQENGLLFTHEANQLDYVALFFDKVWWKEQFDCPPPGLIGAGTGMPVGIARGCGLGYTIKLPKDIDITKQDQFKHFCGDPLQK